MSDSVSQQIANIIESVINPIEAIGLPIDPISIADSVIDKIDPDHQSPEHVQYLAVMQLRGQIRKTVARRHDPVAKMKNKLAEGGQIDAFDGMLQDYYPVSRNGDPVYVQRAQLTEMEIEIAASKMEKAGNSLVEHADALRAWFKSKAA